MGSKGGVGSGPNAMSSAERSATVSMALSASIFFFCANHAALAILCAPISIS